MKKTHSENFFRKWNFLAQSLNNFLYFKMKLAKPKNQNFTCFVARERFKYRHQRKTFFIPSFIKKQNFLNYCYIYEKRNCKNIYSNGFIGTFKNATFKF